MKRKLTVFLIIIGMILGLYVGLWLCFVGGVMQVVESIQGDVNAMGVALGILRFFSALLVGWLCFTIPASIGIFLNKK